MENIELTFEQSASIGALSAALAAAQEEMGNALKDGNNPHFKSAFATLASVREAVKPLAKHKIAVSQWPQTRSDGTAGVRTILSHASGEWMAATAWVKPQQAGPQAFGSVVSYLRRYSLGAAAGIASDDDDGEAAEAPKASEPRKPPAPAKSATPSDKLAANSIAPQDRGVKGTITAAQLARLSAALVKLNLESDDARRQYVRWASGETDIASRKDLSFNGASMVIQRAEAGEMPNGAGVAS